MKILYLGSNTGTSGHRLDALRRLGHEVTLLRPVDALKGVPKIGTLQRYLGSVGLVSLVRTYVLRRISKERFDLAWVDAGALISRRLVSDLKRHASKVINFNVDDPFGNRDVNHWFQYRRAVCAYDMLVVVRKENIEEAHALGARKVLHVFRAADEIAHAPRALTQEELEKWKSEILFVGTGFPERGPFFADLIRLGTKLSIYGNKWNTLKEWPVLQRCWKGPGLEDAYTYSTAILASKVSLGLLSKQNRDLHTNRSMEIPSLGVALCAERTAEHLTLYKENEEAVFWADAEECAAKCEALLADDEWRKSVARRGHQRYLDNKWSNMDVAVTVLRNAFES